jgi:hypothetical protein
MQVHNGDIITLGTVLEATGRNVEHLPTELEIAIMDNPADPNLWGAGRPTTMSTNSFYPPLDSESEADDLPARKPWKPFARDMDASYVSFVREQSSSTSINGDVVPSAQPAQPTQPSPLIDLTVDSNPWVAAEPVHTAYIEISDNDDDYDDDDDEDRSDYEFPYEYDTEDKESVNGETQISKTQITETQIPQTQIFQNTLNLVLPPLKYISDL